MVFFFLFIMHFLASATYTLVRLRVQKYCRFMWVILHLLTRRKISYNADTVHYFCAEHVLLPIKSPKIFYTLSYTTTCQSFVSPVLLHWNHHFTVSLKIQYACAHTHTVAHTHMLLYNSKHTHTCGLPHRDKSLSATTAVCSRVFILQL